MSCIFHQKYKKKRKRRRRKSRKKKKKQSFENTNIIKDSDL